MRNDGDKAVKNLFIKCDANDGVLILLFLTMNHNISTKKEVGLKFRILVT